MFKRVFSHEIDVNLLLILKRKLVQVLRVFMVRLM